jgi:hypothetical protein
MSDDDMDWATVDAFEQQAREVTSAAAATADTKQLCDVCCAKQQGVKVPRRKCSCNSGLTVQIARACDRAKERQQRSETWEDPCSEGLHDVFEARTFTTRPPHLFQFNPDQPAYDHDYWSRIDAVSDPRCAELHSEANWNAYVKALTDWGWFKHRLETYAYACQCSDVTAGCIQKLRDFLGSNEFARFSRDHARSLNTELRRYFGAVCYGFSVDAARLFVDIGGLTVSDTSTYFDLGEAPVEAQPLYHAASSGSVDIVRWLLNVGADPNAPASDGTTAVWVACEHGHAPVLELLREHGADMLASDQDGTSPALIAAGSGHADVVRWLHESGVDLRAPGHIYDADYTALVRNVTPLSIARQWGHEQVAAYLETALFSPAEKRARSDEPMLDRATRAGVADRLKPISASLVAATKEGSGSAEQIQAAKKQLKAIQTANQQIVSRAEKARLKQTKLV